MRFASGKLSHRRQCTAGSTSPAPRPAGLRQQHFVRNAISPPTDRTSLVPQTLHEMEQDPGSQLRPADVAKLTREERTARQRSLEHIKAPSFYAMCQEKGVSSLKRSSAHILQLNIGLYCNQACTHCHVESSPKRTEMMDRATADRCLALLADALPRGLTTLDITGGAPELNAQFRHLVTRASALGTPEIIDRCNLTALLEPGQEDLPSFLAEHRVRVVASLPCYGEKNVDAQRGSGVFERSIQALKLLNAQGYGQQGSGLVLDLVYNPGGPFLAPEQSKLEAAYKSELHDAYGIEFNTLLCLNNMPIKRYADWLIRRGKLEEYMSLLVQAFNPSAGESLMCRDTISVGWDGALYDCDFNQQLALQMIPPSGWQSGRDSKGGQSAAAAGGSSSSAGGAGSNSHQGHRRVSVHDIQSLDQLTGWRIACDNHCYGCTAGSGSSCGGQA